MSPRRYAGWEPTTQYTYDDMGRMVEARPEPEWDDWDCALVDEWRTWQAGVHRCGHHFSEQDDPDTAWQAGFTVCKACATIQSAQEQQHKADKPLLDMGHNPDHARKWFVQRLSIAERLASEGLVSEESQA